MISMKDIADELGVSKSTVSLVLSGKAEGRVSEAMQEKIRQVAQQAHYHVNELARSLRVGSTKTLGIIVTDISNEFFGKLAFHFQEEARRYGYLVLVANSNEDGHELASLARMFISRKVDGIVVVPTEHSEDAMRLIQDNSIPLVQLDRQMPAVAADYVGVDNYGASVRATKHLVAEGCHNICLVSYGLNLNAINDRRHGCMDVLRNWDILRQDLLFNIDFAHEQEDIAHAMRGALTSPVPADAIFFTSHRIFVAGLANTYRQEFTMPRDIRLLCFDDESNFLVTGLHIDYVVQPIRDMAVKAFQLLMDKIDGSTDYGNYTFNAKLVPYGEHP